MSLLHQYLLRLKQLYWDHFSPHPWNGGAAAGASGRCPESETDADFNITGAARAVLIRPGHLAPNPIALLPLLPQFRR